ncbi:MAG: hypothetical protein EPO40_21915 [Myxococcaceae bacterium]|nr:MAG: hypothetical protein EPO40_21915 [Myxococcaceae bacterium]
MHPQTRAFFDSQWSDVCDGLRPYLRAGHPPHELLVLLLDSGRRVGTDPKPLIAIFPRRVLSELDAGDALLVEAEVGSGELKVTAMSDTHPEETLLQRVARHLGSIVPDYRSFPVRPGRVTYVVQTADDIAAGAIAAGAIGPKPN